MGRRLPPLRALQAFEAVARLHSVTAAAEELALTPSAVSHRLAKLEQHLSIRLFHRAHRRILLSDAGRDYLRTIGSSFERIERASDRLAGNMASDVLTVHCPPSFAPAWLLPRIGGFLDAHSDIDLRIHASPDPVDFFRSDTDVEIRYGNADWAGLTVIPLLEDSSTPLCAPSVRESLGRPPSVERLHDAPLIFSERAPMDWERWFGVQGYRFTKSRALSFDRGYLTVQAAALGLGVALESVIFAAPYLADGQLVRVFDDATGDLVSSAYTLVYPPVYEEVPKIIRFREWLLAACATDERRQQIGSSAPSR